MQHANFQISLKGILVNKDSKILGLQPPKHCSFAGFYDLPGGRISLGEENHDLQDILKREIFEEISEVVVDVDNNPIATFIHTVPGKFNDSKNDVFVLYIFFVVKFVSGEIRVSEEHVGYEWLALNRENVDKYFTRSLLRGVKKYLEK